MADGHKPRASDHDSPTKIYDLQVIVEQDEDGLYVIECPALRGCYAQGETLEDAIANIKDVIAMCIRELREEDRDGAGDVDLQYPRIVGIERVEVVA